VYAPGAKKIQARDAVIEVTTIQTSEQIKKKSTSKTAAMWLASTNDRLALPPNMNMAVKSAKAVGNIAGSVPFMSFVWQERHRPAVGLQRAHRRPPLNGYPGGFQDQEEIQQSIPETREGMHPFR